ncbi:MAG: putative glycoside hydrolase [Candidatus Hodarchaeota archaeon]
MNGENLLKLMGGRRILAMGIMPVRGTEGIMRLDYDFASKRSGGLDPRAITAKCAEHGINMLGIVVKDTDGACCWDTSIGPNPTGRDILGEFVDAASETNVAENATMKVVVSFTCFNDALRGQATPESVSVRRSGEKEFHTEGEMKKQDPNTGKWDVRYKTAFHCPSGPHCDYLLDLQEEIAKKYRIMGLLNDYIRYNSAECCFCDRCLERYAEYPSNKDNTPAFTRKSSWWEFRTNLIEDFSRRSDATIKRIAPNMLSGAFTLNGIKINRIRLWAQDWGKMARYLDVISPMVYPYLGASRKFGRLPELVGKLGNWSNRVWMNMAFNSAMKYGGDDARAEILPITSSIYCLGSETTKSLRNLQKEAGVAIFKYFGTEQDSWDAIKHFYQTYFSLKSGL